MSAPPVTYSRVVPDHIDFAVWATSEALFWQSWVEAGICSEPHVFRPGYEGIETSALTWPGRIEKTPAVIDDNGEIITPAVYVSGWHCNVRVTGALAAKMRGALEQFNEDGSLKSVFERTYAVALFGLSPKAASAATGFPAGYRNAKGVTYADIADIATPANVRL